MQVEQIDRDAAADNAVLAEFRAIIREGRADHHAEPFAKHRLSGDAVGYARAVREIVDWLRVQQHGRTSDNYPGYFARQIEAKFGGRDER